MIINLLCLKVLNKNNTRFSSRARAAAMATGNGLSRYNPAIPNSGVGPMRHNTSSWVRSDARPYEGIPMDPNAMAATYGSPSSFYDRSRPYDARSDPRHYYSDRRDSGYLSGYDAPRDNLYPPQSYPSMGPHSGGQPNVYSIRDYRDVPPQPRADSISYGTSR